jgi:hypothetical protein
MKVTNEDRALIFIAFHMAAVAFREDRTEDHSWHIARLEDLFLAVADGSIDNMTLLEEDQDLAALSLRMASLLRDMDAKDNTATELQRVWARDHANRLNVLADAFEDGSIDFTRAPDERVQ